MRRSIFVALILICAILLSGCRDKKSVSEMSDEEKRDFIASEEEKLSPEEKALQAEARQAILDRAAQNGKNALELEAAISNARNLLSEDGCSKLEAAQHLWDRQGRGKDINELVRSGVPAADAYGLALKKRAEWVSLHSSWEMLIEMPGKFGGFYRADSGRTVEIYEMGDGKLNLVMRYEGDGFVFTATGRENGENASLKSESDAMASVQIVRSENDVVKLELGNDFASSSFGKMGALIEGIYSRVKPGEMNVFAQ